MNYEPGDLPITVREQGTVKSSILTVPERFQATSNWLYISDRERVRRFFLSGCVVYPFTSV